MIHDSWILVSGQTCQVVIYFKWSDDHTMENTWGDIKAFVTEAIHHPHSVGKVSLILLNGATNGICQNLFISSRWNRETYED